MLPRLPRLTTLFTPILVALFVAVDQIGCPRIARAEAPDGPEYMAAIRLGLQEYNEQNFAEARAQFLHAHAISPNARTRRALGLCDFALHHYPEAIEWLEAARTCDVRPLDAPLRKSVEALLTTARRYVDRVRFRLTPPEASVWIDGARVGPVHGREILLGLGAHQLEFRAPGSAAVTRKLAVEGGAAHNLRITLSRDHSPMPIEAEWYETPWFWTAAGLLLAGAIAGGVVVLSQRPLETTTAPINGGTTNVVLVAPP
jgi:hypothetical protein